MAKRLIDWTVKGSELVMGKYVDAETPADELDRFNIESLYPNFSKMNEVQQHLIIYGLKQKLADTGSAEKDPQAKAVLARKLFDRFENGEFRVARTGGEAKENKRIVQAGKEKAKVVSLEGLITKKTLFPDTFTEEDEKKLQEFLQMVAEQSKK